MARSGGITFSAVIVFLGSAIVILFGALMIFAMFVTSAMDTAFKIPQPFIVAEGLIFAGIGAWGIASGVGLIKLKEWARISIIVFSSLLVLLAIPDGLTMAFFSFPHADDPNLPQNFFTLLRIGTVAFYGALALLGGVWIYFFNKKSVKAQFQGRVHEGIVQGVIPVPGALDRRPVSIVVIGWYLIISFGLMLLLTLLTWSWFSKGMLAIFFLGFFVFGRKAALLLVIWGALMAVSGVGLLKLKNWARLLGIWLQVLGILNAAMLIAIPADRARFWKIMDSFFAQQFPRSPAPAPMPIPTWVAFTGSFPVLLVILWFLVARKNAFLPRASEGAPPA